MSMLDDSYMKLIYSPNYFQQYGLYEDSGFFADKEIIMKVIHIHL